MTSGYIRPHHAKNILPIPRGFGPAVKIIKWIYIKIHKYMIITQ